MSVRAKFVVISKKETLYATREAQKPMVTIEMQPVSCKHEKNPQTGNWDIVESENTKFWNASPSGKLELGTVNFDAAAQFELGKEYYIDFTPAQ